MFRATIQVRHVQNIHTYTYSERPRKDLDELWLQEVAKQCAVVAFIFIHQSSKRIVAGRTQLCTVHVQMYESLHQTAFWKDHAFVAISSHVTDSNQSDQSLHDKKANPWSVSATRHTPHAIRHTPYAIRHSRSPALFFSRSIEIPRAVLLLLSVWRVSALKKRETDQLVTAHSKKNKIK